MNRDPGIRVSTVLLTGVATGVLSWVLLSWWHSGGRALPQLPWLALLPLLMITAGVLVAGWQVRRYVSAATPELAGRRRVSPERARGTLVAAQASALGGAALLGWYLANALLHLPNADVSSVRTLLLRALASAGAAALVAVAGLVAQWMCRVPDLPDDDDGPARHEAVAS